MEQTCEHNCWTKHAQDINVTHSYSRLNKSNSYSLGVTWWFWFNDVGFSWSFSWMLKKGPKMDWPPWANRVRELKHLGVHVLQLKHDDPFPQARADRSAARSRPDRALWLVFEVKRTLCTATILLALWCGFDTCQTKGLGNRGITPQWGVQITYWGNCI